MTSSRLTRASLSILSLIAFTNQLTFSSNSRKLSPVTVDSIADDGTPVDDSLITGERERKEGENREEEVTTEQNGTVEDHCDDLASNRDRDNDSDGDNDRMYEQTRREE